MPNRLEVPEELQALVEKREGERRKQEGTTAPQDLPTGEERRNGDRRKNSDGTNDK